MLNVTLERPSESEAVLTIALEWNELEKASDRAYRRLVQKYNIPGFRRGHAPRSMLERMVGAETLYEEGLQTLMDESYRDALLQNQLTALGDPELDAPPLQLNQPYTYTVRVPVQPPVHLGDFHSVQVERPTVEVTDEDVEKVLKDLQEQQALWQNVERPAQAGDRISADVKLSVGDKTISDLKDNEFELVEGREGIFAGMDEQLFGMSAGESKDFTTTIPVDYGNEDYAGKEAQYAVTLKQVQTRELPELSDEFAKSAGEYDTLDALRTSVRQQLLERRRANARRDFREALLKAVTDQAQVDIHPTLVKDEAATMADEMRRLLEQNGLKFDQYLESVGKTEAQYQEEAEPDARERVKRRLVLEAIADAEGIQATDDDVEGWLNLMNMMSRGGKRLRGNQLSAGQLRYIANSIRRDKVTQHLLEAAGEPSGEDAEALLAEDETGEGDPAAAAAQAARVGATPSEAAAEVATTDGQTQTAGDGATATDQTTHEQPPIATQSSQSPAPTDATPGAESGAESGA